MQLILGQMSLQKHRIGRLPMYNFIVKKYEFVFINNLYMFTMLLEKLK